jgi:hypothetical protein
VVERLDPDLSDTALSNADERAVSAYMAELAMVSTAAVPALASPDAIWVRAQLIRRWAAERQAERPLETMQSVHIALGLAAALVLLVWSAPALFQLLN